VIDLDNPNQSN